MQAKQFLSMMKRQKEMHTRLAENTILAVIVNALEGGNKS